MRSDRTVAVVVMWTLVPVAWFMSVAALEMNLDTSATESRQFTTIVVGSGVLVFAGLIGITLWLSRRVARPRRGH